MHAGDMSAEEKKHCQQQASSGALFAKKNTKSHPLFRQKKMVGHPCTAAMLKAEGTSPSEAQPSPK
jgi:hypothetical protein